MAPNEAYRKAEAKIEEARRTGATELDLSCEYNAKDSEKLTELPELLGKLTQLQTLKLANNQLTALSPINGKDVKKNGVYEVNLTREWLIQAAPFLKVLAGTLSLVVPVAASAAKLSMEDAAFKRIENQLDLGQKSLDSVISLGGNVGTWLGKGDEPDLAHGREIRANGSALRQLQVWLKEKDPGFGGLIRVQNKRREFLWVHPQYEQEY